MIFIASGEPHQLINTSSSGLEFLCFRGAEILYREDVRRIIDGEGTWGYNTPSGSFLETTLHQGIWTSFWIYSCVISPDRGSQDAGYC